ncbi:hypothetical protein [Leucobacter sp.]
MLGYRTVLTTEGTTGNLDRIVGVLQKWVLGKRFPSMPTEGTVENRRGATLTASSFSTETSTGLRWELVEEWDPPKRSNVVSTTRTAVMHITLVVAEGRLWFWVDIEPPTLTVRDGGSESREDVQYSGTPGFVATLLEEVEMRDGLAEPKTGFQAVPAASYVEQLIRILEDDTRLGAVFVTAPPEGVTVEEWITISDDRSYAMQGLAVGFVLSPEARAEFNRYAQAGHSVPAGGMRTFVPGADLSDVHDSINHRLMLPATFQSSDERRIRRILRNAQIKRLREIKLPEALRVADYEFLRKRRMQPFDVLHQESPELESRDLTTEARLVELEAEATDLRMRLSDAEEMAHEALRDIARFSAERDMAQEEAELERMEAEDSYLKFSRSSREIEKLAKRVEYLQSELVAAGAGAAAWADVGDESEDDYPSSFGELIDRIGDLQNAGQLEGVRFTGDREEVCGLDEHSMLGEAAVVKVWDTLLTFDAYSKMRRTGGFDGSLSNYIRSSAHGGLVRIGKVAWSEGETTKTGKLGAQRFFPVDEEVDPSGRRQMVAHVKLSNLTGVAPRMYFDDTYSAVGYLTVGYLGSHLDNTLTN